jgi:uncharacterized repeat protein (TIGR03803 family)
MMMKTGGKNPVLLSLLTTSLCLILANTTRAQSLTTLYSFSPRNSNTNSDGAYPSAPLIISGNTLYGAAEFGGTSGYGDVFSINSGGAGFTNQHNFASSEDGANPTGGLILSGSRLYGTTGSGGGWNYGTVFSINTNGTGLSILYNFTAPIYTGSVDTNSDGDYPNGSLVLSGATLYGAARFGGIGDNGTLFKVDTNGAGFTVLHIFTADPSPSYTNSDGADPYGSLVLSGDTLYGTTSGGGTGGGGTIFAVSTNGTGFTNLYSFSAESGSWPNESNSDGYSPRAGLILSGNKLYGTASYGGSSDSGTIFAINTDGTGFTNLYSFTASLDPYYTNSDGADPEAVLVLSGNTLYGEARSGGSLGNGTVFAINTDGTGFTNLHSFAVVEGDNPEGGLVLSGNTLYGIVFGGGALGYGAVFALSLPGNSPALNISSDGQNAILSWSTNAVGFTLESATDLTPPVAWSAVTNASTVVAGQNTVTNALTGPQQFYRLTR